MRKNIIDIVDIKKAVTNGEIFFYNSLRARKPTVLIVG